MTMIGFLILFPLVVAVILLAVRNNAARNVVVVAASLVIGLGSIWLVCRIRLRSGHPTAV